LAKRRYLQPFKSQDQSGKQTNRSRTHYCCTLWFPYFQAALNLVCLSNSFLDDGCRLEQHSDFLQTSRYLHDEFSVVDVVLTQITVTQVDPALEVRVVGRHVVCADEVVDA